MKASVYPQFAKRLDEIGLSHKEIMAMPRGALSQIIRGKVMLAILRDSCPHCGERRFTALFVKPIKDLNALLP